MAPEEGPDMLLSPSAHADTFCRDNLPPADQWPDLEFTLPELRYPDRLNAADELLNPTIAAGGADRRCLLSPEETWTYGEVSRRAAQIARVLTEDLGLVPGNRVLLRGPNNPWLAACWLGVLKAGGVAVATMPMLRAAELSHDRRHRPGPAGALRPPVHRGPGAAALPGLRIVTFGGPGPDDLAALAARQGRRVRLGADRRR